jgi:hypothetical protein
MLYTITYSLNDKAKEESFLKELKSLGDAVMVMPHCYFLRSNSGRELIFSKLHREMMESDLLYIAETPISSMSGWLPTSAIDWLNNNQK